MNQDDRGRKPGAKPESRRADWRGSSSSPTGKRPAGGWATARTESPGARTFAYRVRLALAALLVIALGGFVLWKSFDPKQATNLIAIVVTEYDDLMPPNSFAKEDLETMSVVFSPSGSRAAGASTLRLHQSNVQKYSNADFLEELRNRLRKARPAGMWDNWFSADALLLYFSAHGATDSQGEARLILSGNVRGSRSESTSDAGGGSGSSGLDWSTGWLAFEDVLGVFREAEFAWLKSKKIVLLLDCNRSAENWPLGILHNDFAGAIEKALKTAGVPNLFVLNSTSPFQQGQDAPELNGTLFGQFVIQGLAGSADGLLPTGKQGKPDGRITWRELVSYVQENVPRWARNERHLSQMPMAHPKLSEAKSLDFQICFAGKFDPIANRTRPNARQLDELQALWERHDAIAARWRLQTDSLLDLDADLWRINPMDWAEFEQQLIRCERLLLAGEGYGAELQKALGKVAENDRLLQAPRLDLDANLTFPVARAVAKVANAKQITPADREQFARWLTMPPEERAPIMEHDYGRLMRLGWDYVLSKSDLQLSDLTQVTTIFKEVPGWLLDPIEVHFLRMLERHLDSGSSPSVSKFIQQPLRLRGQLEQVAGPADERVHWWLQSQVDLVDGQRRQAEDLLLIGGADSLDRADAIWSKLQSRAGGVSSGGTADATMAKLTARFKEVAGALALRDEASAKLPHIAQWYLHAVRSTTLAVGDLSADLPALIQATRELGIALEDTLGGDAPIPPERTTRVRELLARFDERFLNQVKELTDPKAVGAAIRQEIIDLLGCPLLTGDNRKRLRDKILKEFGSESKSGSGDTSQDEDGLQKLLETLLAWGEHPVVGLLDRKELESIADRATPDTFRFRNESGAAQDAVRIEVTRGLREQESAVRQKLASIRGSIDLRAVPSTDKTARDGRRRRSDNDRLVRNAAGVLVRRTWDDRNIDPHEVLRRFDLHHYLTWQAARTMEDFWARSGPTGDAYFKQAADTLLVAIRRYADLSTVSDQRDLTEQLDRQVRAAQSGIRPQPRAITLEKERDRVDHSMTLTVDPTQPVPRGIAAYSLRPMESPQIISQWDGDQVVRRRAVAVPVSESATPVEYSVVKTDLENLRRGSAEVLFRGHVWSEKFGIGAQGDSRVVSWSPIKQPPPEITVVGDEKQTIDVVFVLDCSDSMNCQRDETRLFFWDGDGGGYVLKPVENQLALIAKGGSGKRLEAEEGLMKTIDLMLNSTKDKYRLGLVVFGHRVLPDRRGKCLLNSKILVNEDVETKFELQDLNPSLRTAIGSYVRTLKPKGRTPLYRSIRDAIDKAKLGTEGISRVIVITDGTQETVGGDPREVGTIVSENDLIAALKLNPRVHTKVVLYGPEPNPQLRSIRDAVGNFEFVNPTDPESLARTLAESIKSAKYRVRSTGDSSFRREEEVGQKVAISDWRDDWSEKANPIEVEYLGQSSQPKHRLTLQGGESIKLRLNAGTVPPQLEHVSPRPDSRFPIDEVRDSLGNNVYRVITHPPVRNSDGGLDLFASIENHQRTRFTPRPRYVWAEVKPVLSQASDSPTTWVFFDPLFVPGEPIPKLQFQIPYWPAESEEAQLKMYFSLPPLQEPGIITKELREALTEKQFALNRLGLAGVSFTVSDSRPTLGNDPIYRVIVREEHTDSRVAPGQVAVWMVPTPLRVMHEYVTESNPPFVRHVFDFRNSELLGPALRFVSRKEVQEHSLSTEELRIRVAR